MKRQTILPLAIFAISVFLAQLTFAAPPRYEIIDLGTLGGGYSLALAINDVGQVVGGSHTAGYTGHAFFWDRTHGMIDLGGVPGGRVGEEAYGVNDHGQVVGYANSDDGSAFIWDSVNGMRYLDGIGNSESKAYAINNAGQVIGIVFSYPSYGFLWEDGAVADLGFYPSAINNAGQVVGDFGAYNTRHAVLWDEIYGMRDLGTLGGSYSEATGINDTGQVVGYSEDIFGDKRAFLWDSTSGMVDLGPAYPRAINNAGEVIGSLSAGGPAFYWDIELGMIQLDELLPTDSGWAILSFANDISNRGQIVGLGITDKWQYHAFLMTPVPPTIYYVDDDAAGANDGSSWADAYNYLQDALAVASSDDEIWVAEGIYRPNQGFLPPKPDFAELGFDWRRASFQLKNGVTVMGGYAGFGTPEPNGRDIVKHKTILSGDLNGDDPNDLNPQDLWGDPNRAENSYHVVIGNGTDATAVLDGFTITGGNANTLLLDGRDSGGGMYNKYGSPTVVNCAFISNSAGDDGLGGGGGMYNLHSNPTIINCTFSRNSADYYCSGGGVYNQYSKPTLKNCTFISNLAESCGGGMNNEWSNPTLTNGVFTNNFASYRGGGMHNGYGSFSPTLTNCTFSGNHSDEDGGGMYNFCGSSSPTLTNCTFTSNSASENGGGMYNDGSIILSNCPFAGNSAEEKGGGIYNTASKLMLINCPFNGNLALHGNALACDSWLQQYPSNLQITNCILWDGGDEIWNNDNSTITITYSDVQDAWLGTGNINVDPCFAEPGYWDANGFWVEGDYHLLADSSCIDAGDPNYVPGPNETDLDGKPRVIGGRIDMGAYEYSPLIPAEARIVPRTINLTSQGKQITCYIWLGEDYNVADIEPNSIFLEDEIKPDEFSVDEQQQVAMARFSREELRAILNAGDIELTITGQLTDGTVFEATDVIRVIDKGGGKPAK